MKRTVWIVALALVVFTVAFAASGYFQSVFITNRLVLKPQTVAGTAGALTLPSGTMFYITGTTKQTSITAGAAGQTVWLKFADTDTVVDGSNLKIAGDFNGTADDMLVLTCNGTNWYEVSRSAN